MRDLIDLTGVIDRLADSAATEEVHIADLLQQIGHRGFGPLLLVPALIALLPTGAVPGVPTLCAVLIFLIAGQLALGRHQPWLPSRLRRASIRADAIYTACRRARPVTRRVDRLLRPRLLWLTRAPAPRLIASLCMLLAMAMVPLELLPFAAAIPAGTIACLAVGLAAGDGLVVLLGLAAATAAAVSLLELLL
jgi:hypothetical protein